MCKCQCQTESAKECNKCKCEIYKAKKVAKLVKKQIASASWLFVFLISVNTIYIMYSMNFISESGKINSNICYYGYFLAILLVIPVILLFIGNLRLKQFSKSVCKSVT